MPSLPGQSELTEPALLSPAHAPDWSALRLLNQYRLLIIMALAAVFYLVDEQEILGTENPTVFGIVHMAYFVSTLCFITLSTTQKLSCNVQFFLQHYLDILFITILMYTSGGVSSGLAPILLINIALLSVLSSLRHALLFAAIGSVCVLGEELLTPLISIARAANFEAAALLGALLFLVAWLMAVPLRHLQSRQMVRSNKNRATLDVQQIAQINEDIIRELDSGVLFVDRSGQVQVMNDTARVLLNVEFLNLPVSLRNLSSELVANLDESERSPTRQANAFAIESSGTMLLPTYSRLVSGGLLIRIDDHSHIRQQYQHLKLASLGRLSASIAHEIRNPLGAISHAVQLVQESENLHHEDKELLSIAERHTKRINRIIEDVLQLSNRGRVQPQALDLHVIVNEFAQRFCKEQNLDASQFSTNVEPCKAFADSGHVDQVLWNLCVNAKLHNEENDVHIHVCCFDAGNGGTVLDVSDNGKGVSDIDSGKLFEPFFSTHHSGTGLGLYIIRELCEINKAALTLVPSDKGAHFRVIWTSAQDMAA